MGQSLSTGLGEPGKAQSRKGEAGEAGGASLRALEPRQGFTPQVRGGCSLSLSWKGSRMPNRMPGRGARTNWGAKSSLELVGDVFKTVFLR